MKKIQIFPGGQPVRPDDFQTVQQEAITTALELIRGLADNYTAALVSGLKVTVNGNNYSVSAGYFWDGTELCSVDAFSFVLDVTKTLYLVKSETEESMRRFQDNTYHKVILTRNYTLTYSATLPANSFRYDELERLVNLLSINPNTNDFRMTAVASEPLNPAYHGTGVYAKCHVLASAYGQVTILAQFTADGANGTLCTIPTAVISVASPIYGQFWNGGSWQRFTWQTNGNLDLVGAGLSSTVNYIQFQVNINLGWPTV
jgi:hypothetical protein